MTSLPALLGQWQGHCNRMNRTDGVGVCRVVDLVNMHKEMNTHDVHKNKDMSE